MSFWALDPNDEVFKDSYDVVHRVYELAESLDSDEDEEHPWELPPVLVGKIKPYLPSREGRFVTSKGEEVREIPNPLTKERYDLAKKTFEEVKKLSEEMFALSKKANLILRRYKEQDMLLIKSKKSPN